MLVCVLLMGLVQGVISLFSVKRMNSFWPSAVAGEYVSRLVQVLRTKDEIPDEDDIWDAMTACIDDRISGLIVRSGSDETFLYGFAPGEDNDFASEAVKRPLIGAMPYEVSLESTVYEINISDSGGISVYRADDAIICCMLPDFVKPDDIAATVVISNDTQLLLSADILVFDISTLSPVRFMLENMIVTLVWALPLSIAASAVFSWFFSRQTSKSIEKIKSALEQIASSRFDVSIGKQDVYELDEISRNIENVAIRLKQNRRARDEWVRSIAHDLNTPVSSIRLLSEGLEDGIFKPDYAYFDAMKRETSCLSARLDEIKFYTDLLSGYIKTDISEYHMKSLIDEACSGYGRGCISIDCADDAVLMIDRNLFLRLMKELLDNAFNASGDAGEISISGYENIILVRNEAKLPENCHDFFEPWARGDASRHEGGCGLGLPICRQIMKLHKGDISIRQDGAWVEVSLVFHS